MSSRICGSCGYTEEDARLNMDHYLCKNAGHAPWERLKVQGGDYRPHYRKDEVDRWSECLQSNYRACLDRERVWLEVIDDLMTAIAADHRGKLSQAYNLAAMKIAHTKQWPKRLLEGK